MDNGITYPRHRARGVAYRYVPVQIRITNPPWLDYTFPREDRCIFDEFSEIWDSTGSVRDSHAVLHHKMSISTRRMTQFRLTPVPGGATCAYADPYWIPRSPNLLQKNNVTAWMNNTSWERGSFAWSDFLSSAFMSFTQQTPTVIDVPNLLKDVITIKGLFKQCLGLAQKFLALVKKLGGLDGHFWHLKTLRKIIKDVSNTFLLNEFGIKPLIREIESVMNGGVAMLRHLDWLRRTQGSVFVARYSETRPYIADDRILDLADNQALGSTYLWLRDVRGTVKYTATAHIRNNLVGLDGLFADTKFYLAAMGGQDVASFLWDLVPFSFVCDWFYNVGEVLNRYARIEPFAGEFKIEQCDTSFKKNATARLCIEGERMADGPIDYGLIRYSEYDRQPSFDCVLSSLLPSTGLTPHQLGILAGLLGQRL